MIVFVRYTLYLDIVLCWEEIVPALIEFIFLLGRKNGVRQSWKKLWWCSVVEHMLNMYEGLISISSAKPNHVLNHENDSDTVVSSGQAWGTCGEVALSLQCMEEQSGHASWGSALVVNCSGIRSSDNLPPIKQQPWVTQNMKKITPGHGGWPRTHLWLKPDVRARVIRAVSSS